MSDRFLIPTEESVLDILQMLFGDDIAVGDAANESLDGQFGATFLDDNEALVAACSCDVPFLAYSGAALSMIPADVAKDTIGGETPSDMMLANFYEVMNICSKLFMSDDSDHLRLAKTLQPAEVATEIAALVEGSQAKTFDIGIPGYGSGKLSFYVA